LIAIDDRMGAWSIDAPSRHFGQPAGFAEAENATPQLDHRFQHRRAAAPAAFKNNIGAVPYGQINATSRRLTD
jgi:hypothetical protein